jgi:hypothetical protein
MTVLGNTNTTSAIGINFLTSNVSNGITARYLVTTTNYTDWYQIGAARYSVYNFSTGSGSLWKFLMNLEQTQSEDANTQFTTAFFALLVLLILFSSFNYMLGFELSNPGQGLILVWIVVFGLSLGGLLNVSLPSGAAWLEKYAIFLITTCITGGMMLSRMRDTG